MGETERGNNMAVMKPLLDMLNHDRSSPNEMRFQQGAFQLVHRGPGILAGEEARTICSNNDKLQLPKCSYVQDCRPVHARDSSILQPTYDVKHQHAAFMRHGPS